MLKNILKLTKKVIFAGFVLYAYNVIMAPLNMLIPINIYTLAFTGIFGIMAIPFLALVLLFVF